MFQRTTKEPLSWCFRRYRIMFLVLCVCATNRKKDHTPASPRSLSLSMSHTYILRRTRIHWLHRMCGHKRTYLSFSLSLSLAFYTLMRLHLNSLSLTLNFVFLFLPLKDVPLTRTCLPTYIDRAWQSIIHSLQLLSSRLPTTSVTGGLNKKLPNFLNVTQKVATAVFT